MSLLLQAFTAAATYNFKFQTILYLLYKWLVINAHSDIGTAIVKYPEEQTTQIRHALAHLAFSTKFDLYAPHCPHSSYIYEHD